MGIAVRGYLGTIMVELANVQRGRYRMLSVGTRQESAEEEWWRGRAWLVAGCRVGGGAEYVMVAGGRVGGGVRQQWSGRERTGS